MATKIKPSMQFKAGTQAKPSMRKKAQLASAKAVETVVIKDCWNSIGVRGDMTCPELEKFIHCRNCPVYSKAASELMDGELPAGYTQEWARYYVQKQEVEALDTQSVVVFRIGDEVLGIPTAVFWEVVEMRTIHSLPHRQSDVLRGLVNVRGELLMCVSLGNLLGIRDNAAKATTSTEKRERKVAYTRLVVIKNETGRLVFASSEVFGIYRFHPDKLQDVPANVAQATATYTKAMLPWEGKMIGVLDEELLFYTLNRSLE